MLQKMKASVSPKSTHYNDFNFVRRTNLFLSFHQTVDADHSKSPEGLLGVLGHMLSGKSLDLLLAAAAATGKLKSFARKFIK